MTEFSHSYRTIGFPLEGFTFPADTNNCNEQADHLFVGREAIIDKLVDLLKSSRPRGSYLIAGYRGAGKTTVIKKALKKYNCGENPKALEIHINLGDTSELTPLGIYYSTVNILREELIDKNRNNWESRFESFFPKSLGITIFLFLAALFPTAWFTWFKPTPDILAYGDLLWFFYLAILILIALKGIVWVISRITHPELKTLKDIDALIERISSEITEGRTANLNNRGFGFGLSRHKKKFPIKAREAEEVLFHIFKRIHAVSGIKIVIVLDEIDKLSDSEDLSEVQGYDKPDTYEAGKISKINTLLGSLKNFITTAEATFFFISGRETLDRYHSEKGSSNSLYESLFDRVFEIPSLLTDQGNLPRGNRLSALIEEYVCRRIRREGSLGQYYGEAKPDYYSLITYSKLAKKYPDFNEDPDLINQHVRQGINVLRNFVHYLTFHSWGNPKRLSSIFEGFIVLKDEINKALQKNLILVISEESAIDGKGGAVATHWLLFNSNHQRSFSFASELTTFFRINLVARFQR